VNDIIQLVVEKLGLSADKVRPVVEQVLGFIRSKVPENLAGQFDSAVGAAADKLPKSAGDVTDLVTKTGLDLGQLKTVFETVMTFLKNKLPADVFEKLEGAVGGLGGGGIGGLFKKITGMFGGKS
jgi:hypothetical protein